MKKGLVLLLSGVILFTSTSQHLNAKSISVTKAEPTVMLEEVQIEEKIMKEVKSANEPTTEALEKAIKAVKSKVNIPTEYSQFDYYFSGSSSYDDSSWNFVWRNSKEGTIQVNCNSKYHITYYSKYDYSSKGTSTPVYLKKELQSSAEEFIKKIAPTVYSKLEFMDSSYNGIYSGTYVYKFQRKENGVSFPDNTVSVSVDAVTGEVKFASLNWLYDVKLPNASTEITKQEAAKKLGENQEMMLVYRTDYYNIYDRSNNSKKAYLVYEPKHSYISLDAKTGEVYLSRSQWIENYYDTRATNNKMEMDSAKEESGAYGIAISLTEEEVKKLAELKSMITRDKAIETVTNNKYLLIDKNLKSFTASLNKSNDSKGNEIYVWNIELRDPRPINYEKDRDFYRAYAYAQVDAKTGKILSFHASLKSYYDEKNQKWNTVKIPYNKELSQKVLENFLKQQMKDRFNKSTLVNSYDDYVVYYKDDKPIYGGYSFDYQRVNEGVIYPYNGIRAAVEGVTGKVYSFYSNWDDNIVFESPKGAITPKEAFEYYINNEGFQLLYEVNLINSFDPYYEGLDKYYDYSAAHKVEQQIRLVYRPDIYPNYISPFTGEQLDYSGKVYKKMKPYTYLDIANTKENRDILLLSDMNIGFEGEYFYPNKEITKGELNQLLDKIGYGYGYDAVKDKEMDKLISREEIAVLFIKKLGLEKMANLKGIYHPGYADQNLIKSEYLGAVALAKGLGLIAENEFNQFEPKSYVTRMDAVRLIMNFIQVQQSGLYY